MADVVCISQESIRGSVCPDPFIISDKKRNMIADILVVDVPLDLITGFAVLALALSVEEVGIDRVVLIHGGRRKVLLGFIQINQEKMKFYLFLRLRKSEDDHHLSRTS